MYGLTSILDITSGLNQSEFYLNAVPGNTTLVFVDGVLVSDFTISGRTLTLATPVISKKIKVYSSAGGTIIPQDYLDSTLSGKADKTSVSNDLALKLDKTGGQVGRLYLPDPVSDSEPVTKSFMDARGRGPRGPRGFTGDTGPAGINWKGDWSSDITYQPMDTVYYDGSSYRALRINTNVTPVDGLDWAFVARKGDTGPPSSAASETQSGIVELATPTETTTGTSTTLATHPAGVKAVVDATKVDYANTSDATKGAALVGYRGRTVRQKFDDYVSVTDYGASPLASAATNFSAMSNAMIAARSAGKECVFPGGLYLINKPLAIHSGDKLRGEGEGTTIQNDLSSTTSEYHRVFSLGEHHPQTFLASVAAANRYTAYPASAMAINADRTTLASGAGADFLIGEIVFVADSVQETLGTYALPQTHYLSRIISKSTDTLIFDQCCPVDIASPIVYKIGGRRQFSVYDEPYRVADRVLVDGFSLIGQEGIRFLSAYESVISNIWTTDCNNAIMANALSFSEVSNYFSDFDNRAIELKSGCTNTSLRNLKLHWKARGATPTSPVSFGERNFRNTIDGCTVNIGVDYPSTAIDMIDIVDGWGHRFRDIDFSVAKSTINARAIYIRGSNVMPKLGEHVIENCTFDWRPSTSSTHQVTFGSASHTYQPKSITLRDCKFKGQRNTATGLLRGTARVKVAGCMFEGAALWTLQESAVAPEESLNSYSVSW